MARVWVCVTTKPPLAANEMSWKAIREYNLLSPKTDELSCCISRVQKAQPVHTKKMMKRNNASGLRLPNNNDGSGDGMLSVRLYAEHLVDKALGSVLKLKPQLILEPISSRTYSSAEGTVECQAKDCSEINLNRNSSQFTPQFSSSSCSDPTARSPSTSPTFEGHTTRPSFKMSEFIYFGAGPAKLPREVSWIHL